MPEPFPDSDGEVLAPVELRALVVKISYTAKRDSLRNDNAAPPIVRAHQHRLLVRKLRQQ
jgi:hypothetical protein